VNEAAQLLAAMRATALVDRQLAELRYVARKAFKDRNAQGAAASVRTRV